jgi:hypothetical protein
MKCLPCVRTPPVVFQAQSWAEIEQIPQHRRDRSKGGVQSQMYVDCQETGMIRILECSNRRQWDTLESVGEVEVNENVASDATVRGRGSGGM